MTPPPYTARAPATTNACPVILTRADVQRVLKHIHDPTARLQAKLLYGAAMCLLECPRLRVKDTDCGQHHIIPRDAKGNEDRVTLLPGQIIPLLHEHGRRLLSNRHNVEWNQTLTAQHLRCKSFRETRRSRQARNPSWYRH